MAKVSESTTQTPIKSTLGIGLKTLSGDQQIKFQKYTRQVLPIDGYVFWVRDVQAKEIQVQGSLHYATDQKQNIDETIGLNAVVFTTQQEIQQFNAIAENVVYIGAIDSIRFAFTSRGMLYEQAGTYHYRGDAIYPAMYSQIIDNPANPVDLGALIATNSMPIWLILNQYMTLYPAMAVSTNLRPPYAAVEISDTKALAAAPDLNKNSTHQQLFTEKVKIIMYGLRNDQALDFQDYILNYSLVYDTIGIMNMPGVIDEKRGQSELGILAQKKSIEFEISYYQYRANNIARQMILDAGLSFQI